MHHEGCSKKNSSNFKRFLSVTRRDILRKYEKALEDENVIGQYIHQCNSGVPSGEHSFHSLLDRGPWAKHPIGERVLTAMRSDIPITFLYGEKSWVDNKYGGIIKKARPNSYTQVVKIPFAGHHVYSDNAFNQSDPIQSN